MGKILLNDTFPNAPKSIYFWKKFHVTENFINNRIVDCAIVKIQAVDIVRGVANCFPVVMTKNDISWGFENIMFKVSSRLEHSKLFEYKLIFEIESLQSGDGAGHGSFTQNNKFGNELTVVNMEALWYKEWN